MEEQPQARQRFADRKLRSSRSSRSSGTNGRRSEQGALGAQVLCAVRTTSAHCDRPVCHFVFFSGTYTYPNGDKYSGLWSNDVRSGPGTYLYAKDQTSFSGEWVEGVCKDGEWAFHDKAPFVAHVVAGKVTEYVQGK
jgi:hypothetical protein